MIRLEKEHFATWFIFAEKLDSGDRITIMVSKKIVSLHGAELPEAGQRREIKGGPLYGRGHVLGLLDKEENIHVWTRKCRNDLQKWELDPEDIVELISMSLSEGKFWVPSGVSRKKTVRGRPVMHTAYLDWSGVRRLTERYQ